MTDDSDSRSIFVKGLQPSVTVKDLKDHFDHCGVIVRITLPTDIITQKSLGYAYIEFASKKAMKRA